MAPGAITKAQIIAALPSLSPQARADVLGAIKALAAMDGNTIGVADQAGVSDDWLLLGICGHLIQRGLITQRNATSDLMRRDAYKQYKEKLPPVIDFLQGLDPTGSKRSRPTLALLAARALDDMLTARKYFSVPNMLTQIDKIPEALDLAYPGYAAGGFFGFLLSKDDHVAGK